MPEKATLVVLDPQTKQPKTDPKYRVDADFNPQSLQLTYRTAGANGAIIIVRQLNTQGATEQHTGYMADLSVDLLFDSTETGKDVRNITLKIAAMLKGDTKDDKKKKKDNPAPPREIVQFNWGTFIFNGSIQSMTETLDFFSEKGVPLRSTVKLSINGVELERADPSVFSASAGLGVSASVGFSAGAGAGFSASASLNAGIALGTTPLTLAQAGDTLQNLAGRVGADWRAIASANNIDNPRLIQPGTVLNLNVGA